MSGIRDRPTRPTPPVPSSTDPRTEIPQASDGTEATTARTPSASPTSPSPEVREVLAHLEDRTDRDHSSGATQGPRDRLRTCVEQLSAASRSDTTANTEFIQSQLLPAIQDIQTHLRTRPGELRADLVIMQRAYRLALARLPAPLETPLTQQLTSGLGQVETDMRTLRDQLARTLPAQSSEATVTRQQVEHARTVASLSESMEDMESLHEDTVRWNSLLDRLSDDDISPQGRLEQYSAIVRRYSLVRTHLMATTESETGTATTETLELLGTQIEGARDQLLTGFSDRLRQFDSIRQGQEAEAREMLPELETMATRISEALPSDPTRLQATLRMLRQYYGSVMEFHEAHVPTRSVWDSTAADAHVTQRESYQAGLAGVNRATQTLRDFLRETLTVPEGGLPTPLQLANARLVTELSQDLGHFAGSRMDLEVWESLLSQVPAGQMNAGTRTEHYLQIFSGWMEVRARVDGTITPEADSIPITLSEEEIHQSMTDVAERFRENCSGAFHAEAAQYLESFCNQLIDNNDRRLIPRLSTEALITWLGEVQEAHGAIEQAQAQASLPARRGALLEALQNCIELRDSPGVREILDLLESSLPEDATDLDRIQVYTAISRALQGADIGPANRMQARGREIAARLEASDSTDLATRSQSLILALNFYSTVRLPQSQARVETQLRNLRGEIRTELRGEASGMTGRSRVELAGNLVQINQLLLDSDLGQAERTADIDGTLGAIDGIITWTVTTLSFGTLDQPGAEVRESIRQSARETVGHDLLIDLSLWHTALLENPDLPQDFQLEQSSAMLQRGMAYRALASGDPTVIDSTTLETQIQSLTRSTGTILSEIIFPEGGVPPEQREIFDAVAADLQIRLEQSVGSADAPGNAHWIAGLQLRDIQEFADASQAAHTILAQDGSPPETHDLLVQMGLNLDPSQERQWAAAQIFSQLQLQGRVQECLQPLTAQLATMTEPEQVSERMALAMMISTTLQQTGLGEEANVVLQDIVELAGDSAPREIRETATLAQALIAINTGNNSEAIALLSTLPQHPLAQTLLENLQNGSRVQRSLQTIAILRSVSLNFIQRGREFRDSLTGDANRFLAETFDWDRSASPDQMERDTLAGWEEVERLISSGACTSIRAAIDQVSGSGRFPHFTMGLAEFHVAGNVERFLQTVDNRAVDDESFDQSALELGGLLEADGYHGAAGQIYQIMTESPRVGDLAQARLEGLPTAVRIRTSLNTLWNILCISRGTPGILAMSSTSGVSVSDAATNGAMAIVPFGIARAVGTGVGSAFAGSTLVRSVLRSSTALSSGRFVVSTVSEAAAFSLSSGLMMSLLSGGRIDPMAHFGSEFASMLVIFALCHGLGMGSQALGNRARQTQMFGEVSAQTGRRVLRPWAQRGLSTLHYGTTILGLERAEQFNIDVGIRAEEESIPYLARLFSAALMDAQMRVAGRVVNVLSGGELHRVERETQATLEAHRLLPALERLGFERPDWRGRTSPEARLVWDAMMTRVARGESAAEVESSISSQTRMELERMVQLVFNVRPDARGRLSAEGRELYAHLFTYLQTRGQGRLTEGLRQEMTELFRQTANLVRDAGVPREAPEFAAIRRQLFFSQLRQGSSPEQLGAFAQQGPEVRRRIEQMVTDLFGLEGSQRSEGRQLAIDLFFSAFSHSDSPQSFLDAWSQAREAAPRLGAELRTRIESTYGFAPGTEGSARIIRAIFARILANGSDPRAQFGSVLRSETLQFTNPNLIRRMESILRRSEIANPADRLAFFEWVIEENRGYDQIWGLEVDVRNGRRRLSISDGNISIETIQPPQPAVTRPTSRSPELMEQAARDGTVEHLPSVEATGQPPAAPAPSRDTGDLRAQVRQSLIEAQQLAENFGLNDEIGVLRVTAFPDFARRMASSESREAILRDTSQVLSEANQYLDQTIPLPFQEGIREVIFREALQGELTEARAVRERIDELVQEGQVTTHVEARGGAPGEAEISLPHEAFVLQEAAPNESGHMLPGLVVRSETTSRRGTRRFSVYQGRTRMMSMELPENMPAALGRSLLTEAAQSVRRSGRMDVEFQRIEDLPEARRETAQESLTALRRQSRESGLEIPEGVTFILTAAGEIFLRPGSTEAPALRLSENLSQMIFLLTAETPFREAAIAHHERLEGLAPGSSEFRQVMSEFVAARDQIARDYVETHRETMETVTAFLETLGQREGLEGHVVRVESRPKAIEDIIPKMMRRGFRSIDALTDIAGTRIVVESYDDAIQVLQAIRENPNLTLRPRIGRDGEVRLDGSGRPILRDQLDRLVREERQDGDLGYRGLHVTVESGGRPVEIQIHTRAMNEWGRIQHDLGYKSGDLPRPLQEALDAYFLEASQYISDLELGATRDRRRPSEELARARAALEVAEITEARRTQIQGALTGRRGLEALLDATETRFAESPGRAGGERFADLPPPGSAPVVPSIPHARIPDAAGEDALTFASNAFFEATGHVSIETASRQIETWIDNVLNPRLESGDALAAELAEIIPQIREDLAMARAGVSGAVDRGALRQAYIRLTEISDPLTRLVELPNDGTPFREPQFRRILLQYQLAEAGPAVTEQSGSSDRPTILPTARPEAPPMRRAATDSDRGPAPQVPRDGTRDTANESVPPPERRRDTGAFSIVGLRRSRETPSPTSSAGTSEPLITRLARAMGIGRTPSTPPVPEAVAPQPLRPRFPMGIFSSREGAQLLVRNLGTSEMRQAGGAPQVSGFLARPVEVRMDRRGERVQLILDLEALPGRESPGREILNLSREQAQALGIRFSESSEPLLPEGHTFSVEQVRPAPSQRITTTQGEGENFYWARISQGQFAGIPAHVDSARVQGSRPNGEVELRIVETRTETDASGEARTVTLVELPLLMETGPGQTRAETLRVEVREGGELGIFVVGDRAQIRGDLTFSLEPRPSPFEQVTSRAQALADQMFGPVPREGTPDPHADARRLFLNQMRITFQRHRSTEGSDEAAMSAWVGEYNRWSALTESYQEIYSGRFTGDRAEGIRELLEQSQPGSDQFWSTLVHWRATRPFILHDMGEPVHHSAHEVYGALFSLIRTQWPPGVQMGPFSLPESQALGERLLEGRVEADEMLNPFILTINPADTIVASQVRQSLMEWSGAELVQRNDSGAAELMLSHNGQRFRVIILMGQGQHYGEARQVRFPSIPAPPEPTVPSGRRDTGSFMLPPQPAYEGLLSIRPERRDAFLDAIWRMESAGEIPPGTSLETLQIPAQTRTGHDGILRLTLPASEPGRMAERRRVEARAGDGTLTLIPAEGVGQAIQVRPPQGHPFRVGDDLFIQRPLEPDAPIPQAAPRFNRDPNNPNLEVATLGSGRGRPVDFVVPGRQISRSHARLVRDRSTGTVTIEDLGSNNGTYLFSNGDWVRVTQATPLQPGDRIALGRVYDEAPAQGGRRGQAYDRAHEAVVLEIRGTSGSGRASEISLAEVRDRPTSPSASSGRRGAVPPPPPPSPRAPRAVPPPVPASAPAAEASGPRAAMVFRADPTQPGQEVCILGSGRGGRPVDFMVPDRQVSRAHALLVRDPRTGAVTIQDLATQNGTYLFRNGDWVRVRQPTPLQPGDRIALGRVYDEAPAQGRRRGQAYDRAHEAVVMEVSRDGRSLIAVSEMVDRANLPRDGAGAPPPVPQPRAAAVESVGVAQQGTSVRSGSDEILENAAGNLFLMQIRPQGSAEPVTDGVAMEVTQVQASGEQFIITLADPSRIYHQSFTFSREAANELGLLQAGTRVVLARIETGTSEIEPGRQRISTFDQALIHQAAQPGAEGAAATVLPTPTIFEGTYPHAQLSSGARLALSALGTEGTVVLGRAGDTGSEHFASGAISGRHLTLRAHFDGNRWVYEVRDGALTDTGAWIPSANGTYVMRGQERIAIRSGSFAELQPGDILSFGPPDHPNAIRFRWQAPDIPPPQQSRSTADMGSFARLHPEVLQQQRFFQQHFLEGQISDGLEIPGRRTVYLEGAGRFVEGVAGGDRERILWDRANDPVVDRFLRDTMALVQTRLGITRLDPSHPQYERHLDQALNLFNQELRRQFRGDMSPRRAMAQLDAFATEHAGQRVRVGDVLQLRIPFCRHLTLLTQAFLVDLGVRDVRMQRGYLGAEAHVYNEVTIGGQRRIIEITDAFWNNRGSVLTQQGAELVYTAEQRSGEIR